MVFTKTKNSAIIYKIKCRNWFYMKKNFFKVLLYLCFKMWLSFCFYGKAVTNSARKDMDLYE